MPRLEESDPGHNLHSSRSRRYRQPLSTGRFQVESHRAPPVQPNQQKLGWRTLTDVDKILNFIRTTKTESGLTVNAYLIPETYDTGIKISDAEMRKLNLVPHEMLGRWNYTVRPTQNVN